MASNRVVYADIGFSLYNKRCILFKQIDFSGDGNLCVAGAGAGCFGTVETTGFDKTGIGGLINVVGWGFNELCTLFLQLMCCAHKSPFFTVREH